MKHFILLLHLIFLNCSYQSIDCTKFKTGTFKYVNENPDDVIITRTDSTQIEVNEKYNTTVISNVKWISNCKYLVTPIKFINYPYEPKSRPIEVEIIETKNNNYTCKAVNDSLSFIIKMVKIK